MDIPKIIKELRKDAKETQVQVAKAIEISERQYQSLEAGSYTPSLETFCKLADHFGVSLDYLAGRSDSR